MVQGKRVLWLGISLPLSDSSPFLTDCFRLEENFRAYKLEETSILKVYLSCLCPCSKIPIKQRKVEKKATGLKLSHETQISES